MKRILSIILVLLLLAGCSGKTAKKSEKSDLIPGDPCDFLIQGEWEGEVVGCTNVIYFDEDYSFSNYCACGSPVEFADLIESYRYRASDQAILLYDGNDTLLETGKVIYVDTAYLVVELYDNIYCYENRSARLPELPGSVTSFAGGLTTPFVSIISCQDGKLEVAHYTKGAENGTTILEISESLNLMAVSQSEEGLLNVTTPTVDDIGSEELPSHGLIVFDENGKVNGLYLYDLA